MATSTAGRLLLLVACIARPVGGSRDVMSLDDESSTDSILYKSNSTGEEYQVTLLITRHGLSCPNIIEKWGGLHGKDFMRGFITDPPIAGAAHSHAEQSGEAAKRWLESHGLELDAMVTSVLARAIETGLRTYDQVKPLYVVPYIREHAGGWSNSARGQEAQRKALQKSLGAAPNVSYRFADADTAGCKEYDWDKFLDFMAKHFLPQLIAERKRNQADSEWKRGNNIVVAVVTHSKFVSEIPDIAESCGGHWMKKDAKKPLNNQILAVPYLLTLEGDRSTNKLTQSPWGTTDCHPCKADSRTPGSEKCLEVFQGISEYDHRRLHKLCIADIGAPCYKPMKRPWFSLTSRRTVFSNLLEVPIADAAKLLYAERQSTLRGYDEMRQRGGQDLPECFIEFCHKKNVTHPMCAQVQTLIGQIRQLYENSKCFGGGKPNMWEFKDLRGIDSGSWQMLELLKQLEVLPAEAFQGMPDHSDDWVVVQKIPRIPPAFSTRSRPGEHSRGVGAILRADDTYDMDKDWQEDDLPLIGEEDPPTNDSED